MYEGSHALFNQLLRKFLLKFLWSFSLSKLDKTSMLGM